MRQKNEDGANDVRATHSQVAGAIFRLGAFVTALAALMFAFANTVSGQAYPDRPVRLVVGFPPGGAADILGRIAAQQLSMGLGQQVVVDNRGGGGGVLPTQVTGRGNARRLPMALKSDSPAANPPL